MSHSSILCNASGAADHSRALAIPDESNVSGLADEPIASNVTYTSDVTD